MHTGKKILCVNGPWWFVQMWLQLYMHQIVNIDLNNWLFPSSSYNEGEAQITRGCQTHGEAASTVYIEKIQEEASSAITEVNQCEVELTVLSNTQKDYQERMKNIN
jgi:hypothetical protein